MIHSPVRRIPTTALTYVSDESAQVRLGGQWEFFAHVPGVLRAVSPDPSQGWAPAAPGPQEHDPAYMMALAALLATSLGWVRPDAGLNWWYGAGRPTDDPRLALLAQVWDHDGTLPAEAARMLEEGGYDGDELEGEFVGCGYHRQSFPRPVAVSELARVTARPRGSHLAGHMPRYLTGTADTVGELHDVDQYTMTAQFTTNRVAGWYQSLCRTVDSQLPTPQTASGRMSWHVRVHVDPIGDLGTYRRSTVTGLMFAGRHSLHTRGA